MIYRLTDQLYDGSHVEYVSYTGSYVNRREVTLYIRVPNGKYLVIPTLYDVKERR